MKRLILGPQRPRLLLGKAMRQNALDQGKIGVISAGWQEAEGDIDIMRPEVESPLIDLGVHARAQALFAAEPDLHAAYRERQDRLTEQQGLYRLRLKQHAIAVRRTLSAEGSPAVIAPERRHAVAQLRALDRHHLRQIDIAHLRFDSEFNVTSNAQLAEQTERLYELIEPLDTIIITGGNLLVLINRVRLFGLDRVLAQKNLVAWSAGAMLLGDRVVLFHERMPQGVRDAELIDRGLGLLPRLIVMPDAKNRLRTGNALRMSAMSRRFAPATCCLLNNGSSALFENAALTSSNKAKYPLPNGKIQGLRTS